MKCIVPLAGPDLWTPAYGLRPLFLHNGCPILQSALTTRSWAGDLAPSDYIFVVRKVQEVDVLCSFLELKWPGCQIVMLPSMTSGGMMSALAGVSVVTNDDPIIIDLADILIDDVVLPFTFSGSAGAIVPIFQSDDPAFSYLVIEGTKVLGAAEKRVISSNASAGVYVFKDRAVFAEAAAFSLRNADKVTFGGAFFVCPMLNGVLAAGLEVQAVEVKGVVAVGKLFH